MPLITANINNFLYSSDTPQDKVVYLKSDSFTIPTPTAGYYYQVAHGLPFTPMVGGEWSTSSSFTTVYDFGTGTTPSSNPSATIFNIELDILADSTYIYIVPTNVSGSTQTVYVRITGLQPSDSSDTVSATQASADNFVLNTDYNYTKLYSSGKITGVSSSSSNTITHNLGIYPQISTWATSSSVSLAVGTVFLTNVRYPVSGTIFATALGDVSVQVTNSTVIFNTGSSSNVNRIDYRIYYDEAGV